MITRLPDENTPATVARSPPGVGLKAGTAPVNTHPVGGERVIVVGFHGPLLPKSFWKNSPTVIVPKVVAAGDVPSNAELLQIFAPLVAPLTDICPDAAREMHDNSTRTNKDFFTHSIFSDDFFTESINFFMFQVFFKMIP